MPNINKNIPPDFSRLRSPSFSVGISLLFSEAMVDIQYNLLIQYNILVFVFFDSFSSLSWSKDNHVDMNMKTNDDKIGFGEWMVRRIRGKVVRT
jgi:hypothetical protein